MTTYDRLLAFVAGLNHHGVPYGVSVERPEAVRITLSLPGAIWEYDFMADGDVEVQRFVAGAVEASEDPLREVLQVWAD